MKKNSSTSTTTTTTRAVGARFSAGGTGGVSCFFNVQILFVSVFYIFYMFYVFCMFYVYFCIIRRWLLRFLRLCFDYCLIVLVVLIVCIGLNACIGFLLIDVMGMIGSHCFDCFDCVLIIVCCFWWFACYVALACFASLNKGEQRKCRM